MHANFEDITNLFLDVGNTLISIDFQLLSDALCDRGIPCRPDILQRAEAAARPSVSAAAVDRKNASTFNAREFYFLKTIEQLPSGTIPLNYDIEGLARHLTGELYPQGNAIALWSHVLPGTREALTLLQQAGLRMHVISNSDGTVEESLVAAELRPFFREVIDSFLVKVEKPDTRIFQLAMRRARCRPEQSLYVGDMYHVDVLGARSAGMHALLVDPYGDWNGIDAATVENLLALARRVQRRGR